MKSYPYSPIYPEKRLPLAFGLVIAVIALVFSMAPMQASAGAEKHAIPTIEKGIATATGTFGASASTAQGKLVRYRLEATMPDNVAELTTLSYVFEDQPDSQIAPDPSSVKAKIVDSRGRQKQALSPSMKRTNRSVSIDLGDIKHAYASLAFGDKAIVEYSAKVSPTAKPGKHPNIAVLKYDDGTGPKQTVEVKAEAIIRTPPATPATQHSSPLPKTGDYQRPLAIVAILALSSLIAGFAAARRRRSGSSTHPGRKAEQRQ